MSTVVVVRPLEESDAAAVAALCGQLGYPSSEAEVAERCRRLSAQPEDAIIVAALGADVVGWIHLHVWQGVESGPDVEIGGLVVDERHRGKGVGRLLMGEAERWARDRRCARVRLRSNVKRTAAHAFYQHLGYAIAKTQYAFQKSMR